MTVALVRRCAIAALAPLLPSAPPPRSTRSPHFARACDAALAGASTELPTEFLAALRERIDALGLGGDDDLVVTASLVATRTIADQLRRLRDARDVSPALVKAYRAQGATAREVVDTIARERSLDAISLVDLARAVDTAAELLDRAWDIQDLLDAIAREVRTVAADADDAPVAFPPRAAPADRPLPGRHKFSASSLNAYAQCPRKWYFRYLLGAIEDKGSSASFYGTAFHLALEGFHKLYPRVDRTDRGELARALKSEVDFAFERHRIDFDSEVEFRLQRRRARRTAKKYLTWMLERARARPFTIVGNETTANVDLEGFAFVGYIDRLDRDDRSGRTTVIDYKTGSIAQSAAEYRQSVANLEEFQLPFYYWARTMAGDHVASIALVPLKHAIVDVEPIELDVVPIYAPPSRRDTSPRGVISVAELERARTRMVEICRILSAGTTERFEVTSDPENCRYCAYAVACPQRPRDEERRFGR